MKKEGIFKSNERGMNPANEQKEKQENEENIENILTQLSDTLKTEFSFASKEKPKFLVHVYEGNDSPFKADMFFSDTNESLEVTGEYSYSPKSLKNLTFVNRENKKQYGLEEYNSNN